MDYSFIDNEYNENKLNFEKYDSKIDYYSKQFYAKNHIPTEIRPGNNSPIKKYKFVDSERSNIVCLVK